jgi:hypothetical protein
MPIQLIEFQIFLKTKQILKEDLFRAPLVISGPTDDLDFRLTQKLLRKLCEKGQVVPSHLYIPDIRNIDQFASGQGGFADVYQASLNGKRVAVKRLRHIDNEKAAMERTKQVVRFITKLPGNTLILKQNDRDFIAKR